MKIKWGRVIALVIIILAVVGMNYLYRGLNRKSNKTKITKITTENSLIEKVNNFGASDLRGEIVSTSKDDKKVTLKVLDYSPTRKIPDEIKSYFIVGENEQKTTQLNSYSKVTTGKIEDMDGKESSFDNLKVGQKVVVFGYENLRPLSSFIPREVRILE